MGRWDWDWEGLGIGAVVTLGEHTFWGVSVVFDGMVLWCVGGVDYLGCWSCFDGVGV
jgi:hypothetical protein